LIECVFLFVSSIVGARLYTGLSNTGDANKLVGEIGPWPGTNICVLK